MGLRQRHERQDRRGRDLLRETDRDDRADMGRESMNIIAFDIMQFSPMTWKTFQQRYISSIRVSSDIKRIRPVSIQLIQAAKQTPLFSVWYNQGDWREGSQRCLHVGENFALVRIPAVKLVGEKRILVLDGMHRITQLHPRIILLDLITIKRSDAIYINDLIRWVL